jgi:hypothetical protein
MKGIAWRAGAGGKLIPLLLDLSPSLLMTIETLRRSQGSRCPWDLCLTISASTTSSYLKFPLYLSASFAFDL